LTRSDHVGVIALQSFGVAAGLGVFMTLVPHASAGGASDGLGMLLSASMPDEHFSYRMALPDSEAAVRLLEQGRAEEALRVVDEALSRLPEHPLLLATRARCLGATGDLQGAQQLLEALRARPELAEIYEAERLHAAACLVLDADALGDTDDAIEACQAALELAPGMPAILVTLGALQHRAGEHHAALQALMLAYKSTREPQLEDRCLAHLAAASRAVGKPEDARLFADTLRSRTHSQRLLQIVEGC
jgi:tetratricopeptide (TPR) repeat protein